MTRGQTKEGKSTKRLAATLACAALGALALTSSAGAAEFGIVPGSTIAKTHEPIHLKCGFGGNPHTNCRIDTKKIQAAPFVTQAGAHPDGTGGGALETGLNAEFSVKDFFLDTPPGFLGNPTAVPPCDRETFRNTW